MDQYREKNGEIKGANRFGKSFKKAAFGSRRKKMQKIIKKAENSPLSTSDLAFLTNRQPNFLGIFASDELESLRVLRGPVYFIVNLDISTQPGSHWLAFRISKTTLEIFDSLGFNSFLWVKYPTQLLKFLSRYVKSHRFRISPVLQPPDSHTCGLFCVFYIYYRQKLTFTNCVKKFSRNLNLNNLLLRSLFDK